MDFCYLVGLINGFIVEPFSHLSCYFYMFLQHMGLYNNRLVWSDTLLLF